MTEDMINGADKSSERRLSIDSQGNTVGSIVFGNNAPSVGPTGLSIGTQFPSFPPIVTGGPVISTLPHITAAPKKDPEPAYGFLKEAIDQMEARGALRDKPQGERSMASIVKTFNALTGKNLTEAEGWEFMVILKMVRGRQGKYNRDDYVDGGAYFGLLGECESARDR